MQSHADMGWSCVGMLPSSWGSAGAFPSLSELHLLGMQLTGSLPASWGTAEAFQKLRVLQFDNTNITGDKTDGHVVSYVSCYVVSAMVFHSSKLLYAAGL